MKLLILCYSFTGNNRLLARALAERMGAVLEEVRPLRRRGSLSILLDLVFRRRPRNAPLAHDVAVFDRVLFIAPLWNMRIAHPLAEAVRSCRGRLPPYDFATLCGYRREGQGAHVRRELEELAETPPEHVKELFVGDLLPEADRRNVRKVSGHRVTQAELERFSAGMKEIASWGAGTG